MASEPSARESKRGRGLQRLALVGLVLLVFGRVLGHEFLSWDDGLNIVNNAQLRPPGWSQVAAFWEAPFKGLYVPAAYTYWSALVFATEGGTGQPAGSALDARLFGLGQLVLHAGAVLLVHAVLRRFVRSSRAAMVGAALFAVHPLQVEAVAWFTEARGLLSGLLVLSALLLFLRRGAGAGRAAWLGATACLLLALASKPSAVVAPLLALVLARCRGDGWRTSVASTLPWFILVAGFAAFSAGLQPGTGPAATGPWLGRLVVALDALGHYGAKFAWPLGLAPDYGRTPDWVLAGGWRQGYFLLPLGAGVALLRWPRRWAVAAFALAALALAPVLGLVHFDHQLISTVADRYAYLALLGPAFGLAALLDRHPRCGPYAAAALAGMAALSFLQVDHWRDSKALFEHNLSLSPTSTVARMQLGIAAEADFDLTAARRHYEAALELDPAHDKAWTNLGNVRFLLADTSGAQAAYERSLELRSFGPIARQNLRKLKKQTEAWRATVDAEQAAAEAGDDRARQRLAAALAELGELSAAATQYELVVDAQPDWRVAASDLAWILAASDPGRALELARDSNGPRGRWTRARAHAARGEPARALAEAAAAIEAAQRAGNEELERRMSGWLAGLERGEPPAELRP